MRVLRICSFVAASFVVAAAAEEALPRRAPGEQPEAEPQLFLDDLGAILPGASGSLAGDLPAPADAAAVESARAALERARRKQARWQRLAREGVLSAVEAESCALQVSRAVVKYEAARCAWQQQQLATLQERARREEVSPDLLAAAAASVATAQTLAAEATAGLRRLQMLQAESHLNRQRRLSAAGVGSKSQVKRAEAALQRLTAENASREAAMSAK